ncbi:hypothetical protein NE237_031099 [Protea cynaroides]|uniref:Uncharacterized protein n=1 Tax=Protea cynaroides TaxID=273540 RepID=A0A9Q0R265_9MAGN|nr:hypothetical protein NE237_031099 [Protea cynaroides]
MTSGGRMTTMMNGGENFPARRHSRRPIPKRGRVKAGIVIGLAHSLAALFSPIRSNCPAVEERKKKQQKDDLWWENDEHVEWRREFSSKEAFKKADSKERKGEGRDSNRVGSFCRRPFLSHSQ